MARVIVGALVCLFMRRRNKKAAAMSGHGHKPSVVEGKHRLDSQLSSSSGTTTGAGKNPRCKSTSSAGISLPSLPYGILSEIEGPISELYSSIGSEDMSQQKWTPGQNYELGVYGAQKPELMEELDSNVAEVHELDGGNRP